MLHILIFKIRLKNGFYLFSSCSLIKMNYLIYVPKPVLSKASTFIDQMVQIILHFSARTDLSPIRLYYAMIPLLKLQRSHPTTLQPSIKGMCCGYMRLLPSTTQHFCRKSDRRTVSFYFHFLEVQHFALPAVVAKFQTT